MRVGKKCRRLLHPPFGYLNPLPKSSSSSLFVSSVEACGVGRVRALARFRATWLVGASGLEATEAEPREDCCYPCREAQQAPRRPDQRFGEWACGWAAGGRGLDLMTAKSGSSVAWDVGIRHRWVQVQNLALELAKTAERAATSVSRPRLVQALVAIR